LIYGKNEKRERFDGFFEEFEDFPWKIFFKASDGVEVPSSKNRAEWICFLCENVLVMLIKMESKTKNLKKYVPFRNDPLLYP